MLDQNPKQQHAKNNDTDTAIHFKGTFIAVMLLGVFMAASWFGIYALFLSR